MNSHSVVQLPLPSGRGEPRSLSLRHLWGIVVRGAGDGTGRHYSPTVPRRGLRNAACVGQFRHTLERVARVIPPERLLAVLVRDETALFTEDLRVVGAHHVIQPAWRGSAAELFLAALVIAREDLHATVALLPCDHLVGHEGTFMDYVGRAARAVDVRPDLAVIIGAPACRGMRAPAWIEPGPAVDGLESRAIRSVARFVRNPSRAEVPALLDTGALVATPVIVAKVSTLLALGRACVPEVLETLEPLQAASSGAEEDLLCEAVYECMPLADLTNALPPRGDGFAVLPFPEFLELEAGWRLPLAS